MNKQCMRRRMRSVRRGVKNCDQKDARICLTVLEMPEYRAALHILLYMAQDGEPDLAALVDDALASGKQVYVPKCIADGVMVACPLRTADDLKKGAFGILEPQTPPCDAGIIDLVLCPGLAFDKSGHRLGYGKGYFDHYLMKIQPFLVGICYTDCIVESVPFQMHDVSMQALISERGIHRVGGLT